MLVLFFSLVFSKVHFSLTEERQFLQWMRTNNVFYTGDDYHLRLGIFISNARYCQEYNRRKGLTFTLGINQFSCHTPAEYKSLLGIPSNNIEPNRIEKTYSKPIKEAPDSFDWREKGVVNPIKNQGNCGSCWAFSTIATSESSYAITTSKLLQFSEQNLVDCITTCSGCSGGWPYKALTYIIETQNGQFNLESDYPYAGVEQSCAYQSSKAIGKVTKYISVEIANETDLKEKVAAYGVASVCIAAGNTPFMSYTGGILDDDQCMIIDHAVAAVGYGTENGIDYWIIRNSWGTTWGEEGYVRMIRNKHNRCLIATRALVAVSYD
ncbi:hypothetical protein M9Y10_040569 [Tritrichomonas musculus]|uniref:Uncharacterized protein n=1 Tax=Tritrichomonas musculus TaxID=1915356 RepID=A0ABR2GP75_9EUKA